MDASADLIQDPQQSAVLLKAKQMLAQGLISEDAFNRIATQFSPAAQLSRPMGNVDPDIDTTKIGPARSLAANQRTEDRYESNARIIDDANRWRWPILGGQ